MSIYYTLYGHKAVCALQTLLNETNTSVIIIIDTVFYTYNFYISSESVLENEIKNTEKTCKYEA